MLFVSGSSGSRKGGVTFGRLVKLLGNFVVLELAIAEAFKIAKGFFPVNEFPPPTRLDVPLVFVFEDIPFG